MVWIQATLALLPQGPNVIRRNNFGGSWVRNQIALLAAILPLARLGAMRTNWGYS